ncbi:MAG TPA: hypothetical protein VM032_10870 [Vicinamibacterales bacterium]|nr:hypothetical protein [Vicinamibacterales bacterium]
MTKSTIAGTLMAMVLVTGVSQAQAQGTGSDGRIFASIEFGAQPQQRTTETSTTFPLYDETATIATSQPVHNGPVFGASGGYLVRPTIGVAVGLTIFNARSSDSAVVATIPDLFFFNRPKVVTATATGLKHREVGVHFQAVWFHPVSEKLEVVLAAGPSLISVKHDLATASVATGTQTVTTATSSESKSGIGFNAGFEGNYRLAPRYLAGLFVRYAGGTVDLPSVPDLKVGGLQAGLGLRLRF